MVRQKKSMIGFDPLAWLDDENPDDERPVDESPKESVEENAVVEKAKEKNAVDEKNELEVKSEDELEALPDEIIEEAEAPVELIQVLGYELDKTALLKGVDLISDDLDEIVIIFYNELFTQYPEIKPLFKGATDKQQAVKLVAAIKVLIENLENENTLQITLMSMGESHQKNAVLKEHYPLVAETLISVIEKKLSDAWSPQISHAWKQLLSAAAETMCSAYTEEETEETVEVKTMEANVTTNDTNDSVILLNTIQDISKVKVLKIDILSMLEGHDEIEINGKAVERIDGSSLQLLCALFDFASHNEVVVNWLEPSEPLIAAAKILGMQDILKLH